VVVAPGDVIAGRFEIRARAGEGGMGTVHRAVDHLTGAEVAVKILREVGPNDLGRFAREATLLAELEHPGIVRYVAHGTSEEGLPYLVMEWLEGRTLGELLHERGVSADEGVSLVRAIAGSLAAAHGRGIVHRDLKPDNILFPGGDLARPILIDFGIARRAGGPRDITRTGLMIGTPGYMAPEQARGEPIDARADVFALGCVLHECLTGVPPFAGASQTAVWVKVVLCDPPEVAGVAPGLAALVARLLAKEPDQRPADAGAVERALAAVGPSGGARRRSQAADEVTATAILRAPACALLIGPGGGELGEAAAIAHASGFRFDPLADGGAVATPSGGSAPVDAAAHLALSLADCLPGRIIAIASGAQAIDRAAALLAETSLERAVEGASESRVVIDEASARRVSIPVREQAGRHHLR